MNTSASDLVFLSFGLVLSGTIGAFGAASFINAWATFRGIGRFVRLNFSIYRMTYRPNPRFPELDLLFLDDPALASLEAQRAWKRLAPGIRAVGLFLTLMSFGLFIALILIASRQ